MNAIKKLKSNAILGLVIITAAYFLISIVMPYALDFPSAVKNLYGNNFVMHDAYELALKIHIVAGTCALVLGPVQFFGWVRRRYLAFHRWAGRVYVGAVLIGSAMALYISPQSNFGEVFGAAMIALSFAWLVTTGMALLCIINKNVAVHKEWVLRSYVVTFAFVSFRIGIVTPLFASMALEGRVGTILWFSWVIPLLITEVILNWRRATSRQAR